MNRYWKCILLVLGLSTQATWAQESKEVSEQTKSDNQVVIDNDLEQKKLFEAFEKTMTKVKLVGNFIIDGKEDGTLKKEEYIVEKVKKTDEGDYWVITARIKYGDVDLAVPVPVEVKWAGKTAVITLDNITIPGLGTFSSRVVIDQGKYAGTWTHDSVGGHLFGKIVPAADEELKKKSANKDKEAAKEKKDN